MLGKQGISSLEYRLQWLEKEVEILERKIEFYDDLSSKIKNWAIVSWFALVSYAITNADWRVAAFSPLLPLCFMLNEACHKRYQMDFIARTRKIMRLLNDDTEMAKWTGEDGRASFPVYDLLNIYTSQHKHDPASQQWGSMFTCFAKASVSLLYWCLIVTSVAVALVLYFAGPYLWGNAT